jgi:hypothetical protein
MVVEICRGSGASMSYDLPPEEMAKVPKAPGTLDEALDAL